MMPQFEPNRFFLGFMAAFGVLLILVGTWEWVVAGAVHQIVLGIMIVLLTALISWLAHRKTSTGSDDNGSTG